MPTVELEESQRYCRGIARRAARNFYYGFYPLSRDQHNAMCAVYAFARHADDVADEDDSRSADARREALEQWKRATQAALAGDYGESPVLPAVHQAIVRFGIPPRYFYELIEGVALDLDPRSHATFSDLYHYCYLVASTIGLICLHVFGYESENAPRLAEKLGIAFQLTNILRDLGEDAARGRLYLPEEDLARFGVSRSDVESGRLERVRELLRFEGDRAEQFYREASPLLGLVDRRSRASLWILTSIYQGILGRMRASGYDVFSRRAGLSSIEKTGILLRGLALHAASGIGLSPLS